MAKRKISSLVPSPQSEAPESRGFTEQQLIFIDRHAAGLSATAAARAAGYACPEDSAKDLKDTPLVMLEVQKQQLMLQRETLITRKDVIDGFLKAVEDAKLMADPQAQIAAWREIGRMLGHYAPEIKKIEVSGGAARVKQKFEALDDAELLKIVEGDIIDVEFEHVH